MARFCTHTHQTVLWHPVRSLLLVALCRCAAHIDEAKRLGTTAAILARRLEHDLKPSNGVLLAHAAHLIRVKAARLARRDRDGPGNGNLAWRERKMVMEISIKEKNIFGLPDASIRASELLLHVIRITAIIIDKDTLKLRSVSTVTEV